MKNQTCLHKLLFIGLPAMALSLFLLLAPAPVHADPLDDFIGFLQSVEQQIGPLNTYGFPVRAQELANSKDTIQCLIDANGNQAATAFCLQGPDELPKDIDMIVDVYIYWMDGDYIGLAYYVGGDFICVFLDNFLTGGVVDICGLLEELAEMAEGIYDAGKAILEFFGNLAADAWGAAKAGACLVTAGLVGCDDDDSPSVPPDVFLFGLLQPYAAEGVEKREAVDSGAFDNYLNGLKTKILAEANKPIEEFNQTGGLGVTIPLFTMAEMTAAATKYTNLVNAGWTDDIINRENKNRKNAVTNYLWVIQPFVQQIADNCANNTTCEAEYTFAAMCTDNINKKQKFIHIDRWKMTPITVNGQNIKKLQHGIPATSQVCQSFYKQHQKEYQEKARAYLVEQKICTESGPSLSCGDLDKYTTCDRLMSAFGQQNACSVNLKAAAEEARAKMMARFRKEGSRFYPLTYQLQTSDTTLTKKPQAGASIFVPEEFPCYRPTHEYFFEKFYNELFGGLPQKVLRAVSKEDAAYAALRDKVKQKVAELNSTSKYDNCSFEISPIDPLLVGASSTYCLSQVKENNDAPGFELSTTVPRPLITIDGRDKPLMFSDLAGELKKRITKGPELVNQKIDLTTSMKPGIVTEKLNPAAKLAPTTRLSGAGTAAVSPGRRLRTPAAGQRVMSGDALPGQQVPGQSVSAKIKAKKSPSVLQKKAAMEILAINRLNTASRPVTIRIKNVLVRQIPFELRYRSGTIGFYKPVQHPIHKFSRTNDLTTLTLSLQQAGHYQIRFKSSGRGPWVKWHNFTVTGNPARVTGKTGKTRLQPTGPRAINPQPEPPGKAGRTTTVRAGQTKHDKLALAVSSKPTRNVHFVPVTIQTPRNGQKYLFTGRSVTIKVKVGNRGGQKLQLEIQQKKKGRYTTINPVIRKQRGHDPATVNVAIKSGGDYRLRAKQMGKGAKWSGWRVFSVIRKLSGKPIVKPSADPTPVRPTKKTPTPTPRHSLQPTG